MTASYAMMTRNFLVHQISNPSDSFEFIMSNLFLLKVRDLYEKISYVNLLNMQIN